jgi:hypothetical protein
MSDGRPDTIPEAYSSTLTVNVVPPGVPLFGSLTAAFLALALGFRLAARGQAQDRVHRLYLVTLGLACACGTVTALLAF